MPAATYCTAFGNTGRQKLRPRTVLFVNTGRQKLRPCTVLFVNTGRQKLRPRTVLFVNTGRQKLRPCTADTAICISELADDRMCTAERPNYQQTLCVSCTSTHWYLYLPSEVHSPATQTRLCFMTAGMCL